MCSGRVSASTGVLDAAIRVLGERGVSAVTHRAVDAEAGDDGFVVVMQGQDQDAEVGDASQQLPGGGRAVEIGHGEVSEDDVGSGRQVQLPFRLGNAPP